MNTIMRYFQFDHLQGEIQRFIAEQFYSFAHSLESELPDGAEKTVALRRLLESKDAAIRASLDMVG